VVVPLIVLQESYQSTIPDVIDLKKKGNRAGRGLAIARLPRSWDQACLDRPRVERIARPAKSSWAGPSGNGQSSGSRARSTPDNLCGRALGWLTQLWFFLSVQFTSLSAI
jgi:hypothetical protein